MQNIIDMWYQVKKPATVVLVLDTSGSMFGEPMKSAIAGTQAFIDAMQPNDRLHLITFSTDVLLLEPSGEVGQVGERLRAIVGGLVADGTTALHRAVIEAVELARQQRAEDVANGDIRTYSIVLLSDGANQSNDGITEAQMLSLFPSGSEADPDQVHIYTIGYGEEANEALLQTLANRTNGKFYKAGTADINEIYFQISSEF
jgi:Ca-activated chloride channel family protein